MIILDGITWDLETKIRRTADITGSDISGLLLDGSYFNDVLATYMSYEIGIAVPWWMDPARYSELYEALTDPVDGHTLVVPYNQGMITITGRIEVVTDEYVRRPGGKQYWRDTTFTITANHPSKFLSLDQVLARGGTPLPELSTGQEGDTWHYEGANGWVHGNYADADSSYW